MTPKRGRVLPSSSMNASITKWDALFLSLSDSQLDRGSGWRLLSLANIGNYLHWGVANHLFLFNTQNFLVSMLVIENAKHLNMSILEVLSLEIISTIDKRNNWLWQVGEAVCATCPSKAYYTPSSRWNAINWSLPVNLLWVTPYFFKKIFIYLFICLFYFSQLGCLQFDSS